MTLKRLVLAFCLLLISFCAYLQQAAVQTPQAVTLAAKALAALTTTTPFKAITLTGTAASTAGSDVESGTVTLQALAGLGSRMDLNLSNSTRHEVRNLSSNSTPQGYWVGSDGSSHAFSLHNCMTDGAWFAPQLTILSQLSNASLVASYIGEETRAGAVVRD